MTRIIRSRLSATLALVLVALQSVGLAHLTAAAPPRGAQVHYDARLDATFSIGIAPDGTARTAVEAGDLQVEKQVTADGGSTLVLAFREDRVTIALGTDGYAVSRGERTAAFAPSTPAADDIADAQVAVRRVLADSAAVRAFRAFVSALEATGATTPAALSTLLDGALVAALDGDVAAASRVGGRAIEAMGLDGRVVRTAGRAQFNDCLTEYYSSLYYAYNTYTTCYDPTSFWSLFLWGPVCSFEFFIRAQQYVFQFISCTAVPF